MRPRADLRMSAVRMSVGFSPAFTMSIVRPTLAMSRACPRSSSATSCVNRLATRSVSSGLAGLPSIVISLPRTRIRVEGNAVSTSRSSSSRWPRSPTIRWLPGTRILTCPGVVLGGVVDTFGSDTTLPGAGRPAGHRPSPPVEAAGRLARGPVHLPAAEVVPVQVGDAVASLIPHVEHEPVSALVYPHLLPLSLCHNYTVHTIL